MIVIEKCYEQIKLSNIANIISSFPLVILLSYLYNIVTDFSNDKIIFVAGFLIVSFLVDIIKRLSYPTYFKKYTYRPDDACNCDLLSNGGPVPKAPGFPSGHMATITFFAIYTIINKEKANYLLLFSLIIGTGWARHYKCCHTHIQIFFGTVFGALMALLWSKIF